MNPFKQSLLASYYYGTLPQRERQRKMRAKLGQEPVSILFYHRVADTHPNPWTIGRRQFRLQIDWLRKYYDLVSLPEAQARIAGGVNQRPTACITFDDGYAENCDYALPLLAELKIPTMYFVTTTFVLTGRPFPHDEAAGTLLAPNSPAQLIDLARAGIEIGAHTRNHADLGASHDPDFLYDEIVGSKLDLEQLLGQSVRYLACPYGLHRNLSPAAFRVAHAAGFDGVCSAYGGYNFPSDDPFHLQRFHADPEMIRLKNWITLDPLKLRNIQRFNPGTYHKSDESLQATSGGGNR